MAKERNKTKATLINGKGSAFHNDRTYEGATEEQKEEIVAKMQLFKETEEKKNLNFYENELEYYNKNFSVWLNNENEKKRKQGNLNRIKTMEEILGKPNKGKTKGRYEPQETIYQLGNAEEQKEQKFNISDDLFKYCLAEFLTKIRKKYGKNMAIIQDDIEELRTQYKKEKEQYEKDKEQFNKNHLGKINAEDFENFMNLIPQYEEEQGIERT